MSDPSVDRILISHRSHSNKLEFGNMIERLRRDAYRARSKYFRTKQAEARHEAAVRSIALTQALQQLGKYESATCEFLEMRHMLGIGSDVPTSLRHQLGNEVGDHAVTIHFQLDKSKSSFGKRACAEHLNKALTSLKQEHNRSEFFWRHAINQLVLGVDIDFDAFSDQYAHLTRNGNELAFRANLLGVRSVQSIFHANRSPNCEVKHMEEALHFYLEANKYSDDLLFDNEYPQLTTHTILCGLRHKIMLRQRIEILKKKSDLLKIFQYCLNYINKLMRDAEITEEADGFRETRQILKRFHRESTVLLPPASQDHSIWFMERYSHNHYKNLKIIMKIVNSF